MATEGSFEAVAVIAQGRITQLLVPQEVKELPKLLQATLQAGYQAKEAHVTIQDKAMMTTVEGLPDKPLAAYVPIVMPIGTSFSGKLVEDSLSHANAPGRCEI